MSVIFYDLIDIVKSHPIIYDINAKGYQKRGLRREKAWQAIACSMKQRGHDITDNGCRRRWNKLKFAYARDRTLRKIDGISPLRSSCAKYFDSLAFLNPFLYDYKARSKKEQPIVLDSESDDDSAINSRICSRGSRHSSSLNNRSASMDGKMMNNGLVESNDDNRKITDELFHMQ